MNVLTYFRTAPFLDAYDHYLHELPLYRHKKIEAFQWRDWTLVEKEETSVVVRSRGGSKTCDFITWLIFHVLRTKETWMWLACKSGQLDQALTYVHRNKFVRRVQRISPAKYDVILWTEKVIRLGIISTSNLGMRVDGIVYDEFEDLQPTQQADIYPQMAGMMTTSPIHHTVYLGTLWIATLFNDYSHQYPVEITPWKKIKWLVLSGMIQQEIDQEVTPTWQIDLLYNCIETAPTGKVFPKLFPLDPSILPSLQHNIHNVGMDFGATDHGVEIIQNGDNIYIIGELEVQLEAHPEAFDCYQGMNIEAESGGYNDSDKYAAKSKLKATRLHAKKQPVTNKWKSERIMLARSKNLYISEALTPGLYRDLMNCLYGEDGLYLKDKLHPNHWTDAFLHALTPPKGKIAVFQKQSFLSSSYRSGSRGSFGSI